MDGGSGRDGIGHEILDSFQLHFVVERSHLDSIVGSFADGGNRISSKPSDVFNESLKQRFVNIHSLDCTTDLTAVGHCHLEDAVGCMRNIRVWEDDRWIIPAEFQKDSRDVSRARGHDSFTCGSRSGEGNQINIGTFYELLSDRYFSSLIVASKNIDNSRREHIFKNLPQEQ